MRCASLSRKMCRYTTCVALGRIVQEKLQIANFKRSFGGTEVVENNYIVAGTAGRAAVNLFYAARRLRSLGPAGVTHAEPPVAEPLSAT